ncbi:MAG: branched-chain amino acid ABC transporter permease, partial [Actinomadura sp.]
MTTNRSWSRASLVVGVLAGVAAFVMLALLPLSASPYMNLQIALIGAYAVAIRGLDVLTGHAGQASLGQSAFFGLGAYTAVYGFGHGWSAGVSLLAAVVMTGVVGAALALPAVRLRGFAFGTITLAAPVIAVPLANRLTGVTGGSQGLTVSALAAPEWTGLADDQWHYYVVLGIAAVAFLLV